MSQVKLFEVQNSYSFHPEYDVAPFVYENGDIKRLSESNNAVETNVENFVGGGESVSLDLVAYNGDGIVFISYVQIEKIDGKLNYDYTITSENELSDEVKLFITNDIQKWREKKEEPFNIKFEIGAFTVEQSSFFENLEDYKGCEFLYSRITKSDVEILIKRLEEKTKVD